MTDFEMGPETHLRTAYSEAWAERVKTRNEDSAVLRNALHRYDLDRFLATSPTIEQFLLDMWRNGVPPSEWNMQYFRETKRVAKNLFGLASTLKSVFRPNSASDMIEAPSMDDPLGGIPDDMVTTLDEFDRVTKVSLPFQEANGLNRSLYRWISASSGPTRWTPVEVWLLTSSTSNAAEVLTESGIVGHTEMPTNQWRVAAALEERDIYVGGLLEFRLSGGKIVYRMRAYLPETMSG